MRRILLRNRRRPSVDRLEARCLLAATPGSVDPSFAGGQGFAVVPAFTTTAEVGVPPFEEATDTAVQPDGKIVLVGSIDLKQTSLIAVARLNADGTPDTSFGQDGKATIPAGRISDVEGVVVRPDGAIVIVAEVFPVAPAVNLGQAEVIQLNPDGSPDTTFGNGGHVLFDIGDSAATMETPEISAAGLLPDGKVIVAGTASGSFFAARVNLDGSLDSTFGTGGQATAFVAPASYPNSQDNGASLAIQADGKLVLAGEAVAATTPGEGFEPNFFYDLAVVRLDADGSLDTTFGGTKASAESSPGNVILPPVEAGTAANPGNSSAGGVAIQADGKIVLGGVDDNQDVATRLDADGTLDPSFGNDAGREFFSGILPASFNSLGLTAAGIGPDGRIALVGTVQVSASNQFTLIRLDADGSPDPTFGDPATPGIAVVTIPDPGRFSADSAGLGLGSEDVSFTPDGQLVLGGTIYPGTGPPQGNQYHFGATRIIYGPIISPTPAPTPAVLQPPADFDDSGRTNFATYYAPVGAFLTQPTAGGPVVTTSFGVAGAGQSIPAPADYTGAGHAELAVYIPSQGVYAIRPASAPDIVVPFGIPGTGQSLPAPGDYEGSGKDDIAVYLPSIGAFGIRPSSDPSGASDKIIPFGIAGTGQSLPAPADYFGTGQDDIAVYLPSIGAFAIRDPRGGPDQIIPFGRAGIGQSIPVPGDYDGSGHSELAVYMPAIGTFAYRPYNGGPDVIEAFGTANDGSIPVPGDYDGSGHSEIAVYDPNYAAFAYRPASGGADVVQAFGTVGLATSLPAAAPAGAIPAEIQATAGTPAAVTAKVSAASVTITQASTIPGGSHLQATSILSGRRSARTPVAQEAGKSA